MQNHKALAADLQSILPGTVATDVPLSKLSRWRIGGSASIVVSPRDIQELSLLRQWIFERQLPSVVIGATSNLLFDDEGLQAIVVRIGSQFANLHITGSRITAEAGTWVPGLARKALLAGLTGLEHTAGIPGTLGGLIYMNGGSQRKGIGDGTITVQSVTECGTVLERNQEQCEFAYRKSVFQNQNEVIASATLQLIPSESKSKVRNEMLRILRDRRRKFPQKLPNCGSTFVSNPAMYAAYGPPGKIIEDAGLKGYRVGNAVVSSMHANFIINDLEGGGAKASDVLRLIQIIRNEVSTLTGFEMLVEVRYVSPLGKVSII